MDCEAGNFDLAPGAPGLHKVRRKVDFQPRGTLLPPAIVGRFKDYVFWRRPAPAWRGVPVIDDAEQGRR